MSKSIFQSLSADTAVELNIKTNALALSDLLDEEKKVNPEYLKDDIVHAEDLVPFVRRSDLFDTESEKIYPELIPDAPVLWLKGKGRPDKPETTEGVILGDEEDCTRYLSTDGAGVGAFEWEKRGGVWNVTRGDTGWRQMKFVKGDAIINIEGREPSFLLIRRIGDAVSLAVGGDTDKGWAIPMIDLSVNKAIASVPRGFRACNPLFSPIYGSTNFDGVEKKEENMNIIGYITNDFADSQRYHNHIGEGRFLAVISGAVKGKGRVARCTIPEITYTTVEPWPDTLPGEPFAICYT